MLIIVNDKDLSVISQEKIKGKFIPIDRLIKVLQGMIKKELKERFGLRVASSKEILEEMEDKNK